MKEHGDTEAIHWSVSNDAEELAKLLRSKREVYEEASQRQAQEEQDEAVRARLVERLALRKPELERKEGEPS